jgi:hypothetical protein
LPIKKRSKTTLETSVEDVADVPVKDLKIVQKNKEKIIKKEAEKVKIHILHSF